MIINDKSFSMIFPGQGSQFVGMGKSLYSNYKIAEELFKEANEILNFDITSLMWNGPDTELNETYRTQPALFLHSIISFRIFQDLFPAILPASLAGHSLGQLSAITASGALSFSEGLKLVKLRGELMKKAGEINPGGMAAILGLDIPTLDKVCSEASHENEIVQVANDNCPGQVVISGNKAAIERAVNGAKANRAKRALPLAVSIAAHSPLMNSIQDEWDNAVSSASIIKPIIPVIGNVSAAVLSTPEQIVFDIQKQMQSRVRWTETIREISSTGINTFLETGSGSVLSGLVKRIVDGALTFPLGSAEDFQGLGNK